MSIHLDGNNTQPDFLLLLLLEGHSLNCSYHHDETPFQVGDQDLESRMPRAVCVRGTVGIPWLQNTKTYLVFAKCNTLPPIDRGGLGRTSN